MGGVLSKQCNFYEEDAATRLDSEYPAVIASRTAVGWFDFWKF